MVAQDADNQLIINVKIVESADNEPGMADGFLVAAGAE